MKGHFCSLYVGQINVCSTILSKQFNLLGRGLAYLNWLNSNIIQFVGQLRYVVSIQTSDSELYDQRV